MKGKITLIQVLLIFVVIICGVTIAGDIMDKYGEKKKLETVKQELATPAPTQSNMTEEEIRAQRIGRVKDLYTRNNDTVGWVEIEGTAVNYPVLHNTQSNAYYLHRDVNRQYSSSGIPFLDYQCKGDGTSDNTIIYAHNMRNGTMFHDLLNYADEAFYNEHKTIMFDTATDIGEYEIFSVLRTKVGAKDEFSYYDFIDAKTPAEFDIFVAECIKRTLYKTDIIPQYGDKLLTLSTCSYNADNERFVVFAKKK